MPATLEPPINRITRTYTPEDRQKVARLYMDGLNQRQIAEQLGIPYSNVSYWLRNRLIGARKDRVDQGVQQAIQHATAQAKAIAGHQVARLLSKSLESGDLLMDKAIHLTGKVNGKKDGNLLVNAANALKTGVSIARQALGLSDTTTEVVMRLDVVSQARLVPTSVQNCRTIDVPTVTEQTTSEQKPMDTGKA